MISKSDKKRITDIVKQTETKCQVTVGKKFEHHFFVILGCKGRKKPRPIYLRS